MGCGKLSLFIQCIIFDPKYIPVSIVREYLNVKDIFSDIPNKYSIYDLYLISLG